MDSSGQIFMEGKVDKPDHITVQVQQEVRLDLRM